MYKIGGKHVGEKEKCFPSDSLFLTFICLCLLIGSDYKSQLCASVRECVCESCIRGTVRIVVCVCKHVPDQLYGTVRSLEQRQGLIFELYPGRL